MRYGSVFSVLRLAAALLLAAAWTAHIGEAAHAYGAHCHVCSVSRSPEPEPGCGPELPAPPQEPLPEARREPPLLPRCAGAPVYGGRAPPLA